MSDKVKEGYSLDLAYDFFKLKYELKYTSKDYVSRDEYRRLCKLFNEKVMDNVAEGYLTKLPFGLGSFWIKKKRVNYSNHSLLDYPHYQETGEIRKYKKPWDYVLLWRWEKKYSKIRHMTAYSFIPSRTKKMEINKKLNSPGGHKKFLS